MQVLWTHWFIGEEDVCWCYFSDPDGLTLELVEIAYYLREEREAAAAEYLRTRPALSEIEVRV